MPHVGGVSTAASSVSREEVEVLRPTGLVAALVLGLTAASVAPAVAAVPPSVAVLSGDGAAARQVPGDTPMVGGRVLTPAGNPLRDALVTLYPASWAPGESLSDPLGGAEIWTDSEGRWSLESAGLWPGAYRVRAGHGSYDARWFGGVTGLKATAVLIGADTDRTDLTIRLGSMPVVKGVVRANGSRIEDMVVGIELADELGPEYATDYFRTSTGPDGSYSFTLPSGRYELEVSDPLRELPTRWFGDVTDRDDATILMVPPGGTLSDVDVDASFQPTFPGRPRAHPKGLRPPRGLARRPLDPIANYQGQARCRPRPKPGTIALAASLRRRYGPVTTGLSRACRQDRSEHYDGRAIDWMVNSENRSQARKGDDFVKWLTMSRGRHVGVMARRLGIMYVIWRDRIWGVYAPQDGWRPYNDCMSRSHQTDSWDNDCHRNHVHISMTWGGARKQTSWWRR